MPASPAPARVGGVRGALITEGWNAVSPRLYRGASAALRCPPQPAVCAAAVKAAGLSSRGGNRQGTRPDPELPASGAYQGFLLTQTQLQAHVGNEEEERGLPVGNDP
jgi:hypothetical protein